MEQNTKQKNRTSGQCWICLKNAESGEHIPKASDLRSLFPNISQKNPIYYHDKDIKNEEIRTINSDHFKNSFICPECNNNLTQPYDRAWETLSDYFSKNLKTLKKNKSFNLKKIFPGNSKNKSKYIQLYFIKIIGCYLSQSGNQSLSKDFSESLRKKESRDDVYLKFKLNHTEIIGISNLWVKKDENNTVVESIFSYDKGYISIFIHYYSIKLPYSRQSLGWTPKKKPKKIKLNLL